MPTDDTVPNIVSLLDRFQTDRLNQDWSAMRNLLHPQAQLESLAAPGDVLTAQQLVAAIRAAMSRGMYSVRNWHVELLDPKTGLADGRVRYRVDRTGITDEARVWVSSERESLIWRMRIFRTRELALTCYRENGPDLGL